MRSIFNIVNVSVIPSLFKKEELFIQKRQQDMIQRSIAKGGSPDGFMHMGRVYSDLVGSARPLGKYTRLHTSLVPEMDSLLDEEAKLEYDKNKIRQALYLVLRNTHSWQDVRDALPNELRESIPECKSLARTRSEAYNLPEGSRERSQYMELKDKITIHAASQLIY